MGGFFLLSYTVCYATYDKGNGAKGSSKRSVPGISSSRLTCRGPIVQVTTPSPATVQTGSNCFCLCTARSVHGLPVFQSESVIG